MSYRILYYCIDSKKWRLWMHVLYLPMALEIIDRCLVDGYFKSKKLKIQPILEIN